MNRTLGLMLLTAAVVALLSVAHAMMNPMPIAAATTGLGGLVAIWVFRRRTTRGIATCAAAGALVGTALHAYNHFIEGRMHPDEGLLSHVAADAALGIAIGAAALALPMMLSRLARHSVKCG